MSYDNMDFTLHQLHKEVNENCEYCDGGRLDMRYQNQLRKIWLEMVKNYPHLYTMSDYNEACVFGNLIDLAHFGEFVSKNLNILLIIIYLEISSFLDYKDFLSCKQANFLNYCFEALFSLNAEVSQFSSDCRNQLVKELEY